MKVLWLSHFVPFPPAGGALQRTYHLLRHTAERHDVHLFALHQPRLLPSADLTASVQALSGLCRSVRVFPLGAEQSPAHRWWSRAESVVGPAPFDVVWLRSPAMASALDGFFREGGADLIHADTIGLWPYVAGHTAAPVALGHHNVESELIARRAEHERSRWKAWLMRRDGTKLRHLEARAADAAAVNITVSALDAAQLRRIAGRAAVAVVENGVDTEHWRPGEPGAETPRTSVFAGTLGWYPNRDAVEFLLGEVWPLLVRRNPDRRLLIVGRDPPRAARDAAHDPRVQVTGFVPDVRPYLREATMCVYPVRVGGGTRLKVLDALAMAKPVVATAICVEGLDLIDGEHYLRAETPDEFVAQIERVESNPDLGRRLGGAGRRVVVDRFDWEVVGRELDRAYAAAMTPVLGAEPVKP
jgi:glycosyltransferase involved in cell wall biosynthesis